MRVTSTHPFILVAAVIILLGFTLDMDIFFSLSSSASTNEDTQALFVSPLPTDDDSPSTDAAANDPNDSTSRDA